MAWLKTTATVRDIADIMAQIVEHFHPQAVRYSLRIMATEGEVGSE